MNYSQTFIHVAADTRAQASNVPTVKPGAAKTVAVLEYELIAAAPYTLTQEEVQFAVHVRRQGLSDADVGARRDALWRAFFSKPMACMRCSPLPKTYGWGLHFDERGRVALVPMESPRYAELAEDPALAQTRAMSSRRYASGT